MHFAWPCTAEINPAARNEEHKRPEAYEKTLQKQPIGLYVLQGEALSDTKWRISGRGIYFRGAGAGSADNIGLLWR